MQRMSGVATQTAVYVKRLEGLRTKVLDTRKTTPGMRVLDKMAVKIGGGENHRMGLFDMILLKDNHIAAAGGVHEAIEAARAYAPFVREIEVECETFAQVEEAIAAGADAVMAGSLLAGVEESPGETIIYNGRKFKAYRGMGSLEAMQQGSKDRYFQDMEDDIKKLVPEGIAARVPYKGTLAEVVYQMIGGLRAGMGYCGAKDIATLKTARFIRITNSGMLESHPHDVSITREAPNYSRGE